MTARVPSVAAEQSVRLLMATLAQHRRQEAALAPTSPLRLGRLRTLPTSSGSAQVRRQATMMRLMSIVEAFVADRLVERFEPHVPPPRTLILEDVYVRAEDNAIGSWPKMTEHYGRWFNIKFNATACPAWQRIDAMTNARNAVAHGLGELTRRMARKGTHQLQRDFATLGISVSGNAVAISERALRECALTGREFIEWLDEKLEAYDLGLRGASAP